MAKGDGLKTIERTLLTAIKMERYGQEFYNWFANSITDRKGKSLLKGLASDEKEHEAIWSKEYKVICGKAPPAKIDIKIGTKAVEDLFTVERKRGDKDIISKILKLGIEIEQKSIDFYSSKSEKVKDERTKEMLRSMAEVERGHREALEDNLFHMKQDGAWWGYHPILDG